jgi:5'-deoxynucleotidase YfbR-like HD superfamily hydrolase
MKTIKFSEANLREVFADLKEFNGFVNKYKSVERLIWYKGVNRRECDGEHCFQVGTIADYLNTRYELGLDPLLLYRYSHVHDAPEAEAKHGDTPAIADKSGLYAVHKDCNRETKPERERKALRKIERAWKKRYPGYVELIHAYNAQADPESRFIYALDKFIASLNIVQDDGRTNLLLGTTLREHDEYKRPRVAADPFISRLYELLYEEMLSRPEHHAAEVSKQSSLAAE